MYKVFFPLLLIAASAPVRADTSIDETRPLNANAKLSVINCAGVIQIQAWDRNTMSLTGRLGEGADKLEITGDASSLRVEVKLPKHSHNVEETVLQLRVPAGVSLDLEGVSSDIAVQGTKGPVRANTVSGDLRLVVEAPSINAQTVSGDLHLEAPSKDTQVRSVSGDVIVKGPQGELVGETVSGNVMVDGKQFSKLWLKSVSGDFNVAATLTDTARANLETLSGGVLLDIPASTNASVDMNTFSGELVSDLGGPINEGVHKASLRLGGGRGQINIHSFSGDIQLRKK